MGRGGSDEHMSVDEKIKDHSSTGEFSHENQLEQLWQRADNGIITRRTHFTYFLQNFVQMIFDVDHVLLDHRQIGEGLRILTFVLFQLIDIEIADRDRVRLSLNNGQSMKSTPKDAWFIACCFYCRSTQSFFLLLQSMSS